MVSELAGDWRLWLVVGAVAVAVVFYRIRPSRRKARISRLPRSLVRDRRRPLEEPARAEGPLGGDATRLSEMPPSAPSLVGASTGPITPPEIEKASSVAPLPPEPEIVIDLTALEAAEPASPPRRRVDLRELEPIEPLPADPWA